MGEPKIIFTIYTYDKNSGGNSIIPNMIKHINKLFDKPVIHIYILFRDDELKNIFNINHYFEAMNRYEEEALPIATPDMIKNKNNIAIYPECVFKNPLFFKNVVRFNFYFNIYETNVDNEYNIFFINSFYKLYNHIRELYGARRIENIKYHSNTNIDYFYNLNYVLEICKDNGLERNDSCYTIRKGLQPPHIRQLNTREYLNYHPVGSYEIKHEISNPDDLCQTFNKYKYFYSYDGFSFLSCIATLCGCISIIVPFSGFKSISEFNDSEHFVNGIAYGDNDEQIIHAINTKDKLRKALIKIKDKNYDEEFKNIVYAIYDNFNYTHPMLKKGIVTNWVPNKNINNDLVNDMLNDCITTNQFTNYGCNVKKLEQIIRKYLEIDNEKEIIVVSNATLAIQCLASSIEYCEDKKINWATQSFTFPSSAQGTLKDATILDIDTEGGLDLNEVNDEINGLIVTNVFGNIVDIDKYVNYCNLVNKFLIFDNAATPYTFYKGKNSLNYGIGSIISFHHTKPIGFGEGGAIIVDKKYSDVIRKFVNFGIELEKDNYFSGLGNNYKMSEISAIYIIQYISDNFSYIKNKHIKLLNYFNNKLLEIDNLNFHFFPSFHDNDKQILSCFTLLFNEYNDEVRIKLLDNNVYCRKYYHPLKNTKNAVNIYKNILCIPCNVDMEIEDIDKFFKIIKNY